MTLVASWFDSSTPTHPFIWTASDTKISFETGATLEGSKIFELYVICKNLSGKPGKIEFRSTLIYAYAGSSMLATNTYATLNTILGNLGGGNDRYPIRPDCESILETALAIMKMHNASMRTKAQILISGACPKSGRPFIGKLMTILNGDSIAYTSQIQFQTPSQTLTYDIIGSHNSEICELINNQLLSNIAKDEDVYWRTPLYVLNDLILNQTYDDIGGNIQLASITSYNHGQLYAIVPSIITSEAEPSKYQNIDIREQIGWQVGDCPIAIPTMILDLESIAKWVRDRWPDNETWTDK